MKLISFELHRGRTKTFGQRILAKTFHRHVQYQGGLNGEIGEDGESALDEVPTGNDGGTKTGGDIRGRDKEGGGSGEDGNVRPGKERDEDRGGEGDSLEGIHTVAPGNYRITDQALNDPKAVPIRFNQNLAAIKVLKLTEEEDRSPTPWEKQILAEYSGCGMAELFAWSLTDACLAADPGQLRATTRPKRDAASFGAGFSAFSALIEFASG